MAFIGYIIGGAAALGSAAIASKGAKDAAGTAAAGSDKQIQYNRESRDIALDLSTPYREAGYSALDKLGAMTGLLGSGDSFGRPAYESAGQTKANYADSGFLPPEWDGQTWTTRPIGGGNALTWDDSSQQWMSSTGSAYGAKRINPNPNDFSEGSYNAIGRAHGGVMYNVNELGPESIYSKGGITRSSNPKTMPPDPRGYVHPNIQGRAIGGTMVDPNSMGDSVYRDGIPGQIQSNGVTDLTGTDYSGGKPWYGDAATGNKYAVGELPPQEFWGSSTGVLAQDGKHYYGENAAQDATNIGGGVVEGSVDENGYPIPQENPYDFTTDPGYQFRLNEGMRALEGSAAARGGLLSGGFGRKAIRYGQDYASNEFSNIYNRISNIAGLGQVSAGQGGVFAQNAGSQMGAAAGQGALSSAYGQMGATNAWSNAFNQIAQLPWDQIQWGNNNSRLTDQG